MQAMVTIGARMSNTKIKMVMFFFDIFTPPRDLSIWIEMVVKQ